MPSFTFCPQCKTKYRTAGVPAFKRLRRKNCQGPHFGRRHARRD